MRNPNAKNLCHDHYLPPDRLSDGIITRISLSYSRRNPAAPKAQRPAKIHQRAKFHAQLTRLPALPIPAIMARNTLNRTAHPTRRRHRMDWGMANRMAQLIQSDGKCMFLPIDHGYFQGPTRSLERPGETIAPLLSYADALSPPAAWSAPSWTRPTPSHSSSACPAAPAWPMGTSPTRTSPPPWKTPYG